MDILLVGINSKYTHSNLALRCIKHYCSSDRLGIYESNINVDVNRVAYEILSKKAKTVAFSCYIFNIEYIKKIVDIIVNTSSETKLLFGGPEPFDENHIYGEGEEYFYKLLYGKNKTTGFINLDDLFGMYNLDYLSELGNRTLYYEASRGCPFSCSYCLSGLDEKVRFKSLDIVKKELDFFCENKVSQVKFVDRTFNANKKYCKEILKYISEKNTETMFHFEVGADLFDEEMFEIISTLKSGIVEFEIGIQSFNNQTLIDINRKSDLEKVTKNIKRLLSINNCHIHVDLISALAYESFEGFIDSFNACYKLDAHYIQVGFLKLLKSSKLRFEAEKYGYKYDKIAPYEVYKSDNFSYFDIMQVKKLENAVSKFHNTNGFYSTLKYLLAKYKSPYEMFMSLGEFLYDKGFFESSLSRQKKYELLLVFDDSFEVRELLKYDYLKSQNTQNMLSHMFVKYDDEIKKLNKDKNKAHLKLEFNPLNFKKENVLVTFDRDDFDKIKSCYKSDISKI